MAKVASKVKSAAGVTFTFADKKGTQLECAIAGLNAEMVQQLAIHGLAQKVGDSYAGADSVEEAIANATEVWKNLQAGNFNVRSSGTGGILAEALARIKGMSVDEVSAALSEMDEDGIDKLKKNAKVKAVIAVIRGERAAAKAAADTEVEFG